MECLQKSKQIPKMGEHEIQATAVPQGEKTMRDKGCDDAAEMFNGDLVLEYSEREESIVRWKLDLSLVPMVRIHLRTPIVNIHA